MIGSSLGPYKILEPLGAGGMGEVYLAEDTRLGRKVAIKVLPPQFASIPERLARFEREAKAAAALNHPHIAAVYDVGSEVADGGAGATDGEAGAGHTVHFIVQEYLQGQSLKDLVDGGRMALKKALGIATEIAEALAAAHDAGIVHRDLKPANAFVTKDGHAKVLDFGLAKLTEIEVTGAASDPEVSGSPTAVGTAAGHVVGTAGYMAPEQVSGEEVDQRADLFAFGCVLYEMVTGKKSFSGRSAVETLQQILHEQPQPIEEIDPDLPAELQRILRKCLAKDPNRRYQGARDLAVDLDRLGQDVDAGRAVAMSDASAPAAAGEPVAVESAVAADIEAPRRAVSLPVAAAAVVAAGIVVGTAVWYALAPSPAPPGRAKRFIVPTPEGTVSSSTAKPLALSPDGERVALFMVGGGTTRLLHVRSLDRHEGTPLPGTEGGRTPFFSPDGQWVGFVQGNELKRVSVDGGPPLPLAVKQTTNSAGASWGRDGTIVFADPTGIYQIPETGGTPVLLLEPDAEADEVAVGMPRHLPGTDAILYTVVRGGQPSAVGVLMRDSGEHRIVLEPAADARYVPTGHLVYLVDDSLFVAPFDLDSLQVSGESSPIRQGIAVTLGAGHFDVSDDGTLVFFEGGGTSASASLVWRTLDGAKEEIIGTPVRQGTFWLPRFSPDGSKIAYRVDNEDGIRLMLHDMERGVQQVFASEAAHRSFEWSPDGEWIYYSSESDQGGDADIFKRRTDLSGEPEPVIERPGNQYLRSVSPDGEWLLFADTEIVNSASYDIWLFSLTEGGEPRAVFNTDANEPAAKFSPDGRWIAWTSTESGQLEVYVTSFPDLGGRTKVSENGGHEPAWAPDGRRLYFRNGPQLNAVDFDPEGGVISAPRELFTGGFNASNQHGTSYQIGPDGERILAFMFDDADLEEENPLSRMFFVVDWFDELRRLGAGGGR